MLYALLVFSVGTSIFLLPKKKLLERENRIASTFPTLSSETLLDKSFFVGFSEFCCDSFPARERLLTLNSSVELGWGKLESGGVMMGKKHNLIKRLEYQNFDKLKDNLDEIGKIRNRLESIGVKTHFLCVPGALDVLGEYAPLPFAVRESREVWRYVEGEINVTERLRERANTGEYVFYKTDHHWTSLGAYYAYCELGEYLGFVPYRPSDFEVETVSESFLGTTYSSALFPFAVSDKIEAFRYAGDSEITVTDLSTGRGGGLYDRSALSGSSKYDFFLGGNRAHVKVESGKPRLILIKDSFANSLVPFLARHYDIDLIDPRYLKKPLSALISDIYSDGKPPLLIIFGIDTLTGNAGL